MLGPTASGKTDLAITIAEQFDAEIISVDSMQVYRGMDIGTAKPNAVERRGVTHHMIDVVDPEEEFSVAEFRRLGRNVIGETDRTLLIVGGSGLHFRALVDPMNFAPTDAAVRSQLEETGHAQLANELVTQDPEAGLHVDLANPRRVLRAVEVLRLTGETPSARAASAEAEDLRRYKPELEFTAIGVDPGEDLDRRVQERLSEMRSGGLAEEVERLQDRMGRTARGAVGYRELLAHLEGDLTLDEAFVKAARNTKRLAKKQRTWFQRDPRIRWIPWYEDSADRVRRAMEVFN